MPVRSAIPGLKRLPKPNGYVTWYWAAAQLSSATDGFLPRTARLWHGRGKPSPEEFATIRNRAAQLSLDLHTWMRGRRPRGPQRERRGTIYFVRAGERIKIGFSQDVPRRLAQLQLFFPDVLEVVLELPGTILLERELHRRFGDLNIRQEWFEFAPPIAAFVDQEQRRLTSEPPLSESRDLVRIAPGGN